MSEQKKSHQFNIREMPIRSREQLDELVSMTGYNQKEVVLFAIERFYNEVKSEEKRKSQAENA